MFSFGKKSVAAVLILLILIAVVGWAWRQRSSLPYITKPLQLAAAPFEYGTAWIMDKFSSAAYLVEINLKNRIEWEALEKENAALKEHSVDYDELAAENKRLRDLLDFRNTHGQYKLLASSVISRDYGTWSNTLIINAGSKDGVEMNMPVITPNGVVGFISDAFDYSARVQLMTDPRTSVGAIVERPESRVSSVVRGNGNVPTEPQFVNIAKDADILEGDTLVTSGFGSIYPKGIYIGKITSIHQNDSDFVKYAVIETGVDFSKLEEVFVILNAQSGQSYDKPGVEPKLVPQTKRDKVEGVKGAAAL
ncbi:MULTISPECIES: rod shape-determining protein MreC [Megasphaera]|uniref:Cell shape-determining protein MreC n=1 Tax=Megasphaera vaginalis (ex Srinivasan et al. 2021) TaxID=1111454 RepID=U7UHL3_9FIRM|nr:MULTISPECIES: rod shape-determining protein MreC [Megasphaera]ERT58379.1 rod shape-determining protein MreC [Megasphaera vaginalis (ex Srinivasan et al. 2021)]